MLLAALILAHGSAVFAEPVQLEGVVLLQPEAIVQQRLASASSLAAYMRSAQDATARAVQGAEVKPQGGGFLVIALRPGGKSNVWLDFEPPLPPSLATSVVSRVRSVEAPAVSDGTVVFALKLVLWGGSPSTKITPMPLEWKATAQKAGRPLEASALADLSWNE